MTDIPFDIRKVTAVPTVPTDPSVMFLVTHATKQDYLEIYMSSNDGQSLRRIPNPEDVVAIINELFADGQKYEVVVDISARDAMTDKTKPVFVQDATADATVSVGGAYYLWDTNNSVWIKTAEAESMDFVFNWASLQDKPNSTVQAIDNAVTASHTHVNKTQLDLVGQDANGNMTYNNKMVATTINNDAW